LTTDNSWLQVPGALDTNGNPIQDECVSVPGIYFAGLDSLASLRAGTVLAAGMEATKITKDIASHRA
jgi:putative flavoprotein involved in K+ transport